MKLKIPLGLLLGLLVALSVFAGVRNAYAVVQDFHLYGSYLSGWGFSPSSMTSPGPTITVNEGDVVNLTLTNQDTGLYASPHQFLLSYHNSSIPQSDDVESPQIAAGETIVFSFTANVSGTFKYYCVFHPSVMYGTFTVTSAIPEFPSLIVLPGFMIAAVLAAILYRLKIKRPLASPNSAP